jgi:hypothetical protein
MKNRTPSLLFAPSLTAAVCALSTLAQITLAGQQQVASPTVSDDDFDDVAQVDHDDAEPDLRMMALKLRQPELDPGYLEGVIFGTPGTHSIEAARIKLGCLAEIKIESIDLVCGLTRGQRRKLSLAAEGDIKRLYDRIKELEGNWRPGLVGVPQAIVRDAIELRNTLAAGPFSGRSLFAKTLDRTLSVDQRARCTEFGGTDRLGTAIRIRTWPEAADKIKEICLSETPFGDDGLERLGPLIGLQRLHLDSTRITDAGLAHLARLTELEALDLERTAIDGSGLAHLRHLQRLKLLNLNHTRTSDDFLAHIQNLTGLISLTLEHTGITSQGVKALRALRQLESLSLCETLIADAGLAELEKLTKLQTLDLGATQISDAGLVHLAGLTNLHVLDLRRTRVSNAGLVHLEGLTNVKYVYLYGTEVTEAGIASLQGALPGAKVIR